MTIKGASIENVLTTRDEAFNSTATFGGAAHTPRKPFVFIGHDTAVRGWIDTDVCHFTRGRSVRHTMTCLRARRIDVQRVASYARGRAELARKSLVVDVASMGDDRTLARAEFHAYIRCDSRSTVRRLFGKSSVFFFLFPRDVCHIRISSTKNVAARNCSARPPHPPPRSLFSPALNAPRYV